MVARTGMSELITKLRQMTNAGTADYAIAGTSYWTDDQLEDVLDRNFMLIDHARLAAVQQLENGTLVYKEFIMPDYDTERNTGGDSVFRVTDSNGSVIGTADYSVNYEQRRITFTADQRAELRYLTANAYELNAAAAEVWDEKAGYYAMAYDVQTDNHRLSRSQLIVQAKTMAQSFRRKRRARNVSIRRSDVR